MSRLRESDLQASVNQLREMFPQHSPATIERILRSQKGVIDAAISIILDTPEDNNDHPPIAPPPVLQPSAEPRTSQPRQQHQHQQRPPQKNRPNFEHIFPPDFLRWPADADVIRENLSGAPVAVPVQQGMPPMGMMPPEPVFHVQPMQPQSGEQAQSWWNRFKLERFSKKKSYSRL